MLHKICVENFFSIAEQQEIDLQVAANAPDADCFRPSISEPENRFPVVVGIYGPNASGKSTVLRSITMTTIFVQQSFVLSADKNIPYFSPFARQDWTSKPTKIIIEYDGQFLPESALVPFRYELQLSNDPQSFAKEVLYECLSYAPGGKFRRIFERTKQKFDFSREFGIRSNDPRVESIRPNASTLNTMAQFNHEPSKQMIKLLRGSATNINVDKVPNILARALNYYAQNPEQLLKLNRELGRLDLGLEEMKILPGTNGPVALFRHFGLDSEIVLDQESAGTRKFVEIFPLLQHVLDKGGLAVIDELDTDVHPLLMPEIFGWFCDKERNPHDAQLLFSAHNPAILDELEKEQVFFCEKPSGKGTRIYGASEIRGLRRGPSMTRKYMLGELGGVPHIG